MTMSQGQRSVSLLAGLIIVVAGLKFGKPLLVPLSLAIVIATVSAPLIHWLVKKKVPRWVAIALTMLINLLVLAGLATLVGTSLADFYEAVPRYQHAFTQVIRSNLDLLAAWGIDVKSKQAFDISSDFTKLVDLLGGLLKGIANAVSTLLFVLLLVGFILAESGRWGPKMALALGSHSHELVRFSTATRELQKYLLVKTAANGVTGLLCASWAALMNVDFPILWGLITVLLNYIPTVGSVIASIPPILLALLTFGPGHAAITALGFVVINATLGSVVEPRIMGRALGLSPLVVLISMVFWWWIWGPVGALLSAPLTMMTKIVLSAFSDLRWISIMLGSTKWVQSMQDQWNEAKLAQGTATAVCVNPDNPRSIPSGVRTTDPPSLRSEISPICSINTQLDLTGETKPMTNTILPIVIDATDTDREPETQVQKARPFENTANSSISKTLMCARDELDLSQ